MSVKKIVPAGEAFTGAARWVNSVWKGSKTGKAALVGVGLVAPIILVAPALAYCVGTAKLDKEAEAPADAPAESPVEPKETGSGKPRGHVEERSGFGRRGK